MTLVMQSGGSKGSFTCAGGAGSAPSGARVRSFTYDSLSELLTSSNPESGSTSYTYDNDGNLSKKTDARNISINYSYDALNRPIARPTPTTRVARPLPATSMERPRPTIRMDGCSTSGRKQREQSCPASMPSSGYLTARSSIDYDAMGRILSEAQCTPANCGTSTYPMAYGYDLAGNISTFVDSLASNHFTLTYSYDTAPPGCFLRAHGMTLSTQVRCSQPRSIKRLVLPALTLEQRILLLAATTHAGFITNETDDH